MRQQDKIIIWPAYFDSVKARKQGRRVPRNIGVPQPRIAEIKTAADRLRLESELVADAAYSKMPGSKSGMLLVKKKESKEKTIKNLATQLQKLRTETATAIPAVGKKS